MRFHSLEVGHRGRRALIASVLLTLFIGAIFVTPGIRHQHQGGDAPHDHRRSHQHSHNSNHSHPHRHGHSHHHGSGHSHSHGRHHHSSDEISVQHSHIHISFLWFELTLPDFFATRNTSTDSSVLTTKTVSLADCEIVTLPTSSAFNQLLLVLLIPGLLLANRRPGLSHNCVSRRLIARDQLKGRLPDEPDTPPPRWTSI